MGYDPTHNGRPRALRPLAGIGTRAATSTLKPLAGVMAAAVGVGMSLERRAVDRVLDSDELERVVIASLDSTHLQSALRRALTSEGAGQLVDTFFDSGLLDR